MEYVIQEKKIAKSLLHEAMKNNELSVHGVLPISVHYRTTIGASQENSTHGKYTMRVQKSDYLKSIMGMRLESTKVRCPCPKGEGTQGGGG